MDARAEQLHTALCRALGIDPDRRGARSAVARAVGKTRQHYNNLLAKRPLVDTCVALAGAVGLRVVIEPGAEPIFEPATDEARRAFELAGPLEEVRARLAELEAQVPVPASAEEVTDG